MAFQVINFVLFSILVSVSMAEMITLADMTTIKNITKRSPQIPGQATLGFVIKEIGMVECMGMDHVTGGDFWQKLLDVGPEGDFGGNYLCLPTCGGECIPNQDIGVAPISLYPFGCKCAMDRCNDEGPIVTQFGHGIFKIVCVQDTRCTCDAMGRNHHVGYLCNWINLSTHRAVAFLERPPRPDIHPTYSPIRWCSCCPQHRFTGKIPMDVPY